MHAAQRFLCVLCTAMLSTPAHFTNHASSERLWEEVGSIKTLMSGVSGELEKFNTLYLGKLEHNFVNMATLLSSLDSNVKNLQERAHVWDTFQLHVAAWNEQISTLHKKVDILSRGQERLETLDVRLGTLHSLEAAVERLDGRLDSVDRRLVTLTRALDRRHGGSGPLFGEFTSRGVLSTLRLIERKVDRLTGSGGGRGRRKDDLDNAGEDSRGRLHIQCNTPTFLEELLRDVASKVDIIFDKVAAASELSELLEEEPEGQGNEVQRLQEHRVLDRLWKRLTAPLKRTARALEAVEATVGNVTAGQAGALLTLEQCCADTKSFTSDADKLLRRVESAVTAITHRDDQLEARLKSLENQVSESCRGGLLSPNTTDVSHTDTEEIKDTVVVGNGDWISEGGSGESPEPPYLPATAIKGCEDMTGIASGVLSLGPAELNRGGRDYRLRYCHRDPAGNMWTVIQRRGDFGGHRQTFNLSWADYKHGFGDLEKEFWFGNDFLHKLTHEKDMVLRVNLEAFDGRSAWAEYNTFRVAPESHWYRLSVSGYSGNASDSLSAHNGVYFSTVDRKQDQAPACCPCAGSYGGGWWFYSCFEANLNGVWFANGEARPSYRGIIWQYWLGDRSLKAVEMKLRPRDPVTSIDPVFEDPNSEDISPLEVPEDP